MNFKKKTITFILLFALLASTVLGLFGCTNSEAALNEYANKLEEQSKALDQYKTKLEEQEKALEENKGTLAGQESTIADYKTKLEDQIKALEDYKKLLDEQAGTITGNQNKIAELGAALTGAQNEITALNATIDTLKSFTDIALMGKKDAVSAYMKLQYIDKYLSDRDCITGEQFVEAQNWIKQTLVSAGYKEEEIEFQPVKSTRKMYVKSSELSKIVSAYETDGKLYKKSGRSYVEDPSGEYSGVIVTFPNIVLKKKGTSGKQIILGAHYDGDGTGDNGSGIATALTLAESLANVTTPNDIVFIFFTAEEYGCIGSSAYANNMTKEEIDNTLYMINLDSLVCGDYCYIYGGVADKANKTVTATGAFDNALAIAKSLELNIKTNPWTYDSPAPGYDTPDYPSPSTGDWSDHKGFKNIGIQYVYCEATNWEIPGPYKEYDGYGETELVGMLMNTPNDYLDYIEQYFPGRPLKHLTTFLTLLNAMLTQENVKIAK